MNYKSFELDQFQIDAISAIDKNHSVVVSAATGTGKTLIADYVINEAIRKGNEVIYTSPIKALSNQKYREFQEAYGDKVGLLTGDVAINPGAPILIMTTEIYRNMLLEKREPFPKLSYVVFDEIHYINDIERGTVWEESLIFSPKHVRFLCLSATIPNYKDFAAWIEGIKGHTVETVNYMKRAVPLEHQLYDFKLGITKIPQLKEDVKNEPPNYYDVRGSRRHGRDRDHGRGGKRGRSFPIPDYISLIKELNSEGALPAIFFTFSRKDAFDKAWEMSKKFDYASKDSKTEIIEFLRTEIPDTISSMESVRRIKQMLVRGFGVHHAGILPKMKEIVEKLFGRGLIKVLFATETFAVGINMPAKTVVMNSIKKYDGMSVRYLSTKEYFQMAGRAGRGGIDKFGRVVVIVNRNDLDMGELERVTSKDVEPITSRFSISYNTVLNLVKNHTKEERDVILRSNFGFFMKKSTNQSRIDQSYVNYLRTLVKMGYVNEVSADARRREKSDDSADDGDLGYGSFEDVLDDTGSVERAEKSGRKTDRTKEGETEETDFSVTWKGSFATHIFAHELVLSELYYSGIIRNLSHVELIAFLTSLEYEPRLSDKFDDRGVDTHKLSTKLCQNAYIAKRLKKKGLKQVYKLVKVWTEGGEFQELLEICNLAEGDIIRLFRRIVDTLKQIRSAIIASERDETTAAFIRECMDKIDRDIVAIEF